MKNSPQNNWKVLSSSYLKQSKWFTARQDAVLLPNGAAIPEYVVLEYPSWACTVAVTKSGEVILISQYRHGIGKTIYEICAGVVDKEDSSYLEGAKRELLEETGYGGGVWEDLLVCSANPATHNNLCYCFLAKDVEKLSGQTLDRTEIIDVHLFSRARILELLQQNEIAQAIHAAALWKYIALSS